MTYAELTQAIQDYLETTETTFVAQIPTFVRQAEDRLWATAQLPVFKKNSSASTVDGQRFLSTPTDFLAVLSAAVVSSDEYTPLLERDVGYLQEAFPSTAAASEGKPRYYALWDDDSLLLGPVPDAAYTVELHYSYKPSSIVTSSTSWLGDNCESALLYGCLVEAYTFLKGEPDLLQLYKARYDEALGRLKILGEGRNKTDMFRADAPVVGVS